MAKDMGLGTGFSGAAPVPSDLPIDSDRAVSTLFDAYEARHLCAHLHHGESWDSLFGLMEDTSWYAIQTCFDPAGTDYLADVDVVRQRAQNVNARAADRGEGALPHIHTQVRCALVQSSLQSLAATVSPDLLVELVRSGAWTFQRARASGIIVSDHGQRANALAVLLSVAAELGFSVAEDLSLEIVRTAVDIVGDFSKKSLLSAVAPYLASTHNCEELITLARTLGPRSMSSAMTSIAAHLPDKEQRAPLLHEALRAAMQAPATDQYDAAEKAKLLVSVASGLKDLQERHDVMCDALRIADTLPANSTVNVVLPVAAKMADCEERRRALRKAFAAAAKDHERSRPSVMASVAKEITEPEERRVAFEAALQQARQMADQQHSDQASFCVAQIAQQMSTPEDRRRLLEEALHMAQRIGNSFDRAEVLAYLTEYFAAENDYQEVLRISLQASRQIEAGEAKTAFMTRVVRHLSDSDERKTVLEEVFEIPGLIDDAFHRASCLSTIASLLGESGCFEQAVRAARRITIAIDRVLALTDLVGSLAQAGRYAEAVRIAKEIHDAKDRNEAMAVIAKEMAKKVSDQDALQDALRMARSLPRRYDRMRCMLSIAPKLASVTKRRATCVEALRCMQTVGDEVARSHALACFAEYIPGRKKQEHVLLAARDGGRPDALAFVCEQMAKVARADLAVETADEIGEVFDRAIALGVVAGSLADPRQGRRVFTEAVKLARGIPEVGNRAWALAAVAERMRGSEEQESVFQEALRVARRIPYAQVIKDGFVGHIAIHAARAGRTQETVEALRMMDDSSIIQTAIGIAVDLLAASCEYVGVLEVVRRTCPGEFGFFLLFTVVDLPDSPRTRAALGAAAAQLADRWELELRSFVALSLSEAEPLEEDELQDLCRTALAEASRAGFAGSRVRAAIARRMAKAGLCDEALHVVRDLALFDDKFSTLTRIAPYASSVEEQVELLSAMLRTTMSATREVGETALRIPRLQLVRFWDDYARELSQMDRPMLLGRLTSAIPIIRQLGGSSAVESVSEAIEQTGHWWP